MIRYHSLYMPAGDPDGGPAARRTAVARYKCIN